MCLLQVARQCSLAPMTVPLLSCRSLFRQLTSQVGQELAGKHSVPGSWLQVLDLGDVETTSHLGGLIKEHLLQVLWQCSLAPMEGSTPQAMPTVPGAMEQCSQCPWQPTPAVRSGSLSSPSPVGFRYGLEAKMGHPLLLTFKPISGAFSAHADTAAGRIPHASMLSHKVGPEAHIGIDFTFPRVIWSNFWTSNGCPAFPNCSWIRTRCTPVAPIHHLKKPSSEFWHIYGKLSS